MKAVTLPAHNLVVHACSERLACGGREMQAASRWVNGKRNFAFAPTVGAEGPHPPFGGMDAIVATIQIQFHLRFTSMRQKAAGSPVQDSDMRVELALHDLAAP